MRTYRTIDQVVAAFQRLQVGQSFRDCWGNVIERAGETDVFVNAGYQTLPIVTYIGALWNDRGYVRYPLPEPVPFNPFAWP